MPKTIGSFEEFSKLSLNLPSNRVEAVKTYLRGGIIKLEGSKLVYPNVQRLEKQVQEREEKLRGLASQLKEWADREKKLKTDKKTDMAAVAVDPLYWEHKMKLMTDKEYREVYELVKPPMHLMNRKKWRKRIEMFVKSKEYRIRLKEARLSQIGKKREKMADEAETRMDFDRRLATLNKEKIEKKKRELEREVSAMRELIRWAKESRP
ncbi:MAG: hypothetical protein J7L23_04705 [Candidatus Diapherotrites archaeon]|nr:hypothetical protein [Candidatus Diapherotrites archaeon]